MPALRSPSGSPARTARRFRPTVERLEERTVLSMINHGGAILPHVEVEAVFLGSAWQNDPTLAQAATGLEAFLGQVTNSSYMDMLTQAGYGVGRGGLAGSQVLADALPVVLDDSSIQHLLQFGMADGTLPAPDANRLYFVFVEPGVIVTQGRASSAANFLGYHSDALAPTGVPLAYAVVPYPAGPSGLAAPGLTPFQSATSVASHELAESVTDPFGENVGRLAWIDTTRQDGEIADLAANVLLDLDGYVVVPVVNRHEQTILPAGATLDPNSPAGLPRGRHPAHHPPHRLRPHAHRLDATRTLGASSQGGRWELGVVTVAAESPCQTGWALAR